MEDDVSIPAAAHRRLWSLRDCTVIRIPSNDEGAMWLGLRNYIAWTWADEKLDVRLTDEGKALAARERFEPKVTCKYG